MSSVVLCTWGEDLIDGAAEVLTLARSLAKAQGLTLRWVTLGALRSEVSAIAAAQGVASIDHIEDAKLDGFGADIVVETLTQYRATQKPQVILFSQTPASRLVAPRLAARIGAGVAMNAVAIEAGAPLKITASAFGGDTRVVYEVASNPVVVGVMAIGLLAQAADAATSPETRAITVSLGSVSERVRVIERPKAEGPRLEDAEIIVSGGRGLQNAGNYKLIQELAAVLGGMHGASRPIVDEGWIDSSRQVGLTGKLTRPNLYLAAGISGASQHMAGCSAAKMIVAINKDPDAAIFRYAKYGIVGDCLEILPELIKAAQKK